MARIFDVFKSVHLQMIDDYSLNAQYAKARDILQDLFRQATAGQLARAEVLDGGLIRTRKVSPKSGETGKAFRQADVEIREGVVDFDKIITTALDLGRLLGGVPVELFFDRVLLTIEPTDSLESMARKFPVEKEKQAGEEAERAARDNRIYSAASRVRLIQS